MDYLRILRAHFDCAADITDSKLIILIGKYQPNRNVIDVAYFSECGDFLLAFVN